MPLVSSSDLTSSCLTILKRQYFLKIRGSNNRDRFSAASDEAWWPHSQNIFYSIDNTVIKALSFLREGPVYVAGTITVGVAIGVAVIVFITALIQGLQTNLIDSTLGSQSHIQLVSPDETDTVAPVAARKIYAG